MTKHQVLIKKCKNINQVTEKSLIIRHGFSASQTIFSMMYIIISVCLYQ
jgi:hypothetical protein